MVSFLKNGALGVGVAVVFFILVELILMISGVVPLYQRSDPSVGFSGYAPLFTRDNASDGQEIYKTAHNKFRWFNPQSFPVDKPKGTTRIFCLGGSTTYGRPYNDRTSFPGWLNEFLPAVDPHRNWEVINAGGISYASYRVARVMGELAEYEPDLFIVYTGHNEFLEERTYSKLMQVPEFLRGLNVLASHLRLYSVIYDLMYKQEEVLSAEVKTVLESSVGLEAYSRDDDLREAILDDYENSLHRMTDISDGAGANIIFVTPASNIRDFSPFKTEPGPGLRDMDVRQVGSYKQEIVTALEADHPARALTMAEKALAIDDRDAELHYLYARALLEHDRAQEAREAFIRARDEDICPLRAPTPMIEIVENITREKSTGYVDFAGLVDELADDGIPGSGLFLDHVHPTIEGNRLLALAIIEEMAIQGIVNPTETWNDEEIAGISEELVNSLDEKEHAMALRNLSKVLSWAGKNDEAERLANEAVELIPDDSEAQEQKGLMLMQSGNMEAAREYYREAVRLNPWNGRTHQTYGVILSELGDLEEARKELETAIKIDPELERVHYDLGVVPHSMGRLAKAEASYKQALKKNPERAECYNNLGIILATRGNLAEAYEHFEKALQIDPHNEDAANNLARARNALGR